MRFCCCWIIWFAFVFNIRFVCCSLVRYAFNEVVTYYNIFNLTICCFHIVRAGSSSCMCAEDKVLTQPVASVSVWFIIYIFVSVVWWRLEGKRRQYHVFGVCVCVAETCAIYFALITKTWPILSLFLAKRVNLLICDIIWRTVEHIFRDVIQYASLNCNLSGCSRYSLLLRNVKKNIKHDWIYNVQLGTATGLMRVNKTAYRWFY